MRFRNRFTASVAAVALAATSAVTTGGVAGAAPMTASVTVVHAIPNTPVTVYANGTVLIKDFKFGNVVGPVSLKPATYALAVRPFGASATSKPILSASVTVTAGENATVVANLTSAGKPTLNVFGNPTTSIPMGDARVIVRHVAEAPAVDVLAGAATSKPLISNLINPKSATLVVPASTYNLSVFVHGMTTKPVIGPAKFNFLAGKTYIIYAIGSATANPSTLTVAVQSY